MINGYGKILRVDLSTHKLSESPVNPDFALKYIGGMGFSCRMLLDELPSDTDPLAPENILIFATGILTGTTAPCAARTEVTTRHPLNGNIGSGNTGGMFGTMLKRAGINVIIINGRSARPEYVRIDNETVTFHDASHLWGKDTHDTTAALSDELGAGFSVLCIGPAGENLVRFSCPLNDYHHTPARSGAGAVMGSKNLKAIAVRGNGKIIYARPEAFREFAKAARERVIEADNAVKLPGAPLETREYHYRLGSLPGKNFQTGVVANWLETRTARHAKPYITHPEGVCFACPTPCFNLAEVKEGKYAGTKANRGTHPGVVLDFGAKCDIGNLPAIWKLKETCQLLGLDYAGAAGVLSFAMELFQRGIIIKQDTGLDLTWGNEDASVELLENIASRKGFGNILAEGSVKAAATIGKQAYKYVMAIKGMEMMSSDPRSAPRGWAFGELSNPRGGDNVKNTHSYADRYNANWWFDKFDMPDDIKSRLYSLPGEQVSLTWDGKPLMARWFEDMYSAANALGVCFFPIGFRMSMGPTHMARLYSDHTGVEMSPEQIVKAGEMIFTLLKLNAVRFGFTRKDDIWPERFFTEEQPEGPSKGKILSHQQIDSLLDEYYDLRGWDRKTSFPTPQKLRELGLDDLIKFLPETS